jgi:hypothetical protein
MIMEYDLDWRRVAQYLSYDAFVGMEEYGKSFEEFVLYRGEVVEKYT